MSVTITQGTQTIVAADTVSGAQYQIVKLDTGAAGASSPFTGTLSSIPVVIPTYWSATVNTGTNTMGTIKAAVGAGTRIYVTDLIVSVGSASNVVIGDGTVTSILAGTFNFAANGGLTSNYKQPLMTSQGGTLVYQQSAGGPMCIVATGYTAP
jgi:hypothetical protein